MTFSTTNPTPQIVDTFSPHAEWVLLPRVPTEEILRAMRGRALAADCSTAQGARDIYSNIVHAAVLANTVLTR